MSPRRARPSHLQLVPPPETAPSPRAGAHSYKNRLGDTYYLHQGATKTGKPRYFVAKTVGPGALGALPAGLEIAETANGVVSVRRIDTSSSAIPPADMEAVRAFLAKEPRLRGCVAEVRKGEILISEPVGGSREEIAGLAQALGLGGGFGRAAPRLKPTRYTPVMKLEPDPERPSSYVVHRMTYRGEGGFMVIAAGPLRQVLDKYVRRIGTDAFFELF